MFFGEGFGHDAFPRKPVDNETFYKILGVSKSAGVDEIKKAFKKLAIKHHPDKGGDQEKFKEVCKAYEVLSDPEKRGTYDKFGEEGLESMGNGGAQATDIFDMFFGGGSRRPRGPKRGEDVVSELKWSLEQFYNGATRRMAITHDVICANCDGHGGPADAMVTCEGCHGTGIRVVVRSMGPMFTKSQTPCPSCNAQGKFMPESKKCRGCDGRGVTKEKKILEVVLDKGAPEGHKIVFRSEADQKPGEVAGDVVFVCTQLAHDTFKRNGMDLFMEKRITLFEALTSFSFYIDHLDGHKRYISCDDRVIEEGMILAVQGEGMPKFNQIFVMGNIYMKFHVQMPSHPLNAECAGVLKSIFPRMNAPVVHPPSEDSEIVSCKLMFIDPESTRTSHHDNDDDEEGGGGGPAGVQCRQA